MAKNRSIVNGSHDPKELAKHRDGRCKQSEKEIIKALEGNYRPELIFSLKQSLESYDFFQAQIITCEEQIKNKLESWDIVSEAVIPVSEENTDFVFE